MPLYFWGEVEGTYIALCCASCSWLWVLAHFQRTSEILFMHQLLFPPCHHPFDRYILANPDQCKYMELYPSNHPSARHSNFDWSTGNTSGYPLAFRDNAMGNEVVLQAGDALYLPTYWFHQITSLELNFQCNTRSGYEDQHEDSIRKCGFS